MHYRLISTWYKGNLLYLCNTLYLATPNPPFAGQWKVALPGGALACATVRAMDTTGGESLDYPTFAALGCGEPPAMGAAKKRETDKPAKKGGGFNPPWPMPGMKGREK
jgi:hypothetical protein